jgi:hypothetical protein
LLEQEIARRASDSPSEGEGIRIDSLEVEATGKAQEEKGRSGPLNFHVQIAAGEHIGRE